MNVQPNSTIMFYGDLGLAPNSEDTRYFASENDKGDWFNALTPIAILQNQSYSRRGKGVVRVQTPNPTMQTLYNAQYMRFRNISFENKWFYAFVTRVEYINNEVADVYYQDDVMMTWMGNFILGNCFVEREHVKDDSIGAHTVDEGLDTGEYICEQTINESFGSDMRIGVWRTYDPESDDQGINPLKQGTYAPVIVNFYPLNSDGITYLNDLLTNLTRQNRIDQIIAMKLVPAPFTSTADTSPTTYTKTVPKPYSNFVNNDNIPDNNKLYTYPYKYLALENSEGGCVTYKYEYFNTYPPHINVNNCEFRFRGTVATPAVSLMAIPHNYCNETWNYKNALEMIDFPSVPWNVDTYKAYIAQRDSSIGGEIISSTLMGTFSGLISSASPWGAAIGGVSGGIGAIAKSGIIKDTWNELAGTSSRIMPNETRGKANSDIMAQSRVKDFYFRKMCITPERMKIIDGYFNMYGYRVNETKTPSMNNRTRFTYVKTQGCNIHGRMPAEDARIIEEMFDRGTRFWKAGTTIGNYSEKNKILA